MGSSSDSTWCSPRSINPSHKSHSASDEYPTMLHFVTEVCTHPPFLLTQLKILMHWYAGKGEFPLQYNNGDTTIFIPLLNEVEGDILVSPRPAVQLSGRLSVCGQNRVRSVPSLILARSISYLHILSSNFRRCVAFNFFLFCKMEKFEVLANSLNL